MLVVRRSDNGFEITNDAEGQSMFIVVRNINSNVGNRMYQLMSGDVLKLGRIKFMIKEVQINGHRRVSPSEEDD